MGIKQWAGLGVRVGLLIWLVRVIENKALILLMLFFTAKTLKLKPKWTSSNNEHKLFANMTKWKPNKARNLIENSLIE